MISILLALSLSPPPPRPFDFDLATAAQVSPRVEWSRADVDADGMTVGIVQRQRPVFTGVFIEDVYPFAKIGEVENPLPFRRLNTATNVLRNHKVRRDMISGRAVKHLAPIPQGAKRLPVAPPPRPALVMIHEGDPDVETWCPEFCFPPGIFVPDI